MMAATESTRWYDNWSREFGTPLARVGGLRGFTPNAIISRHAPDEPTGLWLVALSIKGGLELFAMTCKTPAPRCYAVQDDFGNLVAVQQ